MSKTGEIPTKVPKNRQNTEENVEKQVTPVEKYLTTSENVEQAKKR